MFVFVYPIILPPNIVTVKRGEWDRRGESGPNFERDFNVEHLQCSEHNNSSSQKESLAPSIERRGTNSQMSTSRN